jgi:hypothetical protein
MKRIVALLPAALLASGCTVSKDGIGIASRSPDAVQVEKTREQLVQDAASEPQEAPFDPGILIVGRTGPFRPITDAQRDEFYRAYVKFASEWHPAQPPALSGPAFQEKIGGWASIETSSVLGWHWRTRVLVPAAQVHDTRFASAAGSFMFGTTGDLVAAKGDHDGLVWLDRVLCKSGRSFDTCAEKYQVGVFDENTGREIDRDRKRKPQGEWIDVASYVRLSKDPARHKASELDPRAINRCDDCKGAVPGSVQTTVQPPQLDER